MMSTVTDAVRHKVFSLDGKDTLKDNSYFYYTFLIFLDILKPLQLQKQIFRVFFKVQVSRSGLRILEKRALLK